MSTALVPGARWPGTDRTTAGSVLPWWRSLPGERLPGAEDNCVIDVVPQVSEAGRIKWIILREGGADPHWRAASWYGWSTGVFLVVSHSAMNEIEADHAFPCIKTSPRIDRRDRTAPVTSSDPAVQPVAGQVREIQTALSVNKSELARILRVSRPTVYDWLDDGEPNAGNIARIQQLLSLLGGSQVSSANPLFPRLVRHPLKRGMPHLAELLSDETLDEDAVVAALHQAKTMSDAIDRERREREGRLRAAGFEGVASPERKTNLASNVALLDWPRE